MDDNKVVFYKRIVFRKKFLRVEFVMSFSFIVISFRPIGVGRLGELPSWEKLVK